MSLGFGALGVNSSAGETNNVTQKATGGGGSLDLVIGGSPAHGLAVGGAFIGTATTNPSVDSGTGWKEATNTSMTLAMVGPMVDGFPDPEGGFHVGGMLGAAVLSNNGPTGDTVQSGGGGLAAWTGYGWWVSDNWSLGGLLRLGFAATKRTQDIGGLPTVTQTDRTWAVSLEFTALYH